MKKIALSLLTVLCVGLGSFACFRQKEKVIKVTPFSNKVLPEGTPFAGLKVAEEMNKLGYRFEWVLMQEQPKKRDYFKRLAYFLKNLNTEKIIFNNIVPPFSKAKLKKIPKEKLILLSWEPPTTFSHQYKKEVLDLFGKVFTCYDELLDGEIFFKLHYPDLRPMDAHIFSFEERKFLCMINSNLKSKNAKELYTLRHAAATFFENAPEGTFDLYGRGWEGFKNAKGLIPDKHAVLKEYKFNICFENSVTAGYISEKIFDSFAAGVVPIYLGAPNIEDYIPKECFIDYRQFNDFDKLLTFLEQMTKEEYESHLLAIQTYLKSPEAHKFTPEYLSETLSKALN